MYQIDKIQTLRIGVQGENNATNIEIDMSSWANAFPDAQFHVLFKPYNSAYVYPMTSLYDIENQVLTWKIGAVATAVVGVGYTEIRAQDSNGLIKKTRIIPTVVEDSVSGIETDPPEAQEEWVTEVLNAGTDAKNSAAAAMAYSQGKQIKFEIGDDDDPDGMAGHLLFYFKDEEDEEWEDYIDLGPVDVYAMAVATGYTGTKAQWVQSMNDAESNAQKAEKYAVGKVNGTDVGSTDPTYHNNSKYYSEQAAGSATDANAAKVAAQAAQSAAETAAQTNLVEWLEENITNPDSPPLDRTLSSSSAATPADITGDLKSAINYNDYLVPETFSTTYTRSASIKEEDGTNGTEGFRTGYIDYTKPMKISFNKPGETFVVWAYSNSSTSAETKISPTKKYVSGSVYLPLITTPIKRFRIGFHKDNGGTYTEEEAAASFAAVKFYSQTDKTLLLENVPADAKATGEKTTANRNDIDDILIRMGRKNWFNPNDADVVEGQYISSVSSGSEVWTENASYGETGFIPVQLGDKITFFYAGATAVSSPYKVYYNSAKEPISGSGTMPDNKYVTISDNSIKYIRTAFQIAKKDSLMIVKLTDQDATPYSPSGEVYVPYPNLTLPYIIKSTDEKIAKDETGGQWNGKTWYAYGTSITANNGASGRLTYVKYLADMSGMTAVNKGLGGKGIGTWAGDHEGKVYDAICNITDGKLNADIITLETGANDIKNDGTTPLGTIYDTGRDSLSGCLNDCLRYLQENTTAQIVVMTSPVSLQKSITSENHQYYTWADMVEEICRLNRVHFVNSDNNMGYAKLDSTQGSLYIRDTIHQTDLGSFIMAQNIWYQLRNIPMFYTAIPT